MCPRACVDTVLPDRFQSCASGSIIEPVVDASAPIARSTASPPRAESSRVHSIRVTASASFDSRARRSSNVFFSTAFDAFESLATPPRARLTRAPFRPVTSSDVTR